MSKTKRRGRTRSSPAQTREQQHLSTSNPGEGLDTHSQGKQVFFLSILPHEGHEGRKEEADRKISNVFQHTGEKEARLLPFWLAFLPFVPLARGEGAQIITHYSPGCSHPSAYVGPGTSSLFSCEQFGD